MKTRTGFVSNSSTTSFCIYGAVIDPTDKMTSDDIYSKAHDAGLEAICGSDYSDYDDCYYIGRSWSTIGDYETGIQFKLSVAKAIQEAFGEHKYGTYEEAWKDG